ncbi:hypothetical protein QJQ45_024081 [Haematococcus lacustris]|nr:hypothetical protein QJQ45_024081 [Haematococcus lacustris]
MAMNGSCSRSLAAHWSLTRALVFGIASVLLLHVTSSTAQPPPPSPPSASPTSSQLTATFQTSSCPLGQFFDISIPACSSCPTGSFPSSNQLTCISCDGTSGSTYNFDVSTGSAIYQTWSPARNASTASCACAASASTASVVATVTTTGASLQRCVTCPSGTQPNPSRTQCVPSSGILASTTPLQDLQFVLNALSLSINIGTATQASFPTTSVSSSLPLTNLLGPSAKACFVGQDRAACNAVANLCVLQNYNGDSAACRLYDALVIALSGSSTTRRQQTSVRPNTGPLPWLYYGSNTYSTATDVQLNLQFADGDLASGTASRLTFQLSTYALNGSWLGFKQWTSQFQLCGSSKWESSKWLQFGWGYVNSCGLDLAALMTELPPSREPLFYDLFLQTSPSLMYPVPVKVANYDQYMSSTDPGAGAVRRFYVLDGSLGTGQPSSTATAATQPSSLEVLQYASAMRLVISLRSEPRSTIFPPQLSITYTSRVVDIEPTAQQPCSFSVAYVNSDGLGTRFWYAWQTMLIVFEAVIGFPLFMWRVYAFLRRRKGEQSDQELIPFALITLIDVGSLALCVVLGIVSLYYLILYKLQESVLFLMLQDSELYNFRVTVIIAIIGQSLALLYRLHRQINVDIFFLDWEKPRSVLSRDGGREEEAPISAWRMLMLANELAELQTTRVTSTAFTMLMMVMILVGANVQAAGDITPDASDFAAYRHTQTSIILRWGVEVAFLLVLFLGQYLFRKLVWFPYVGDPLTNFIDLMYLANISAVVMDDKHTGYYLHGRNHSQHSDTTLRQLNTELDKEGEGLVANRGLVTNNQGEPRLNESQLFAVYIPDSLRQQLDQKILRQVEQAAADARQRKGNVSSLIKGTGKPNDSLLKARDEVAELWKQMVDEVERNHAVQVVNPTYAQMVMQLPPEASHTSPVFVHDFFRSFATTLFLGSEVRLYVFEALFFLAVDMDLHNIPLAALLTFIMATVPPQPPRSSQAATQPAASGPVPSTPPPAKRSKRTEAEPAADPTQPTKGTVKGKDKAAKVKPPPQPGKWLDRDCNAALNMQRIGESRWRPLELCYWPEQGALSAKGKEYPGLGYKRLRDKPPKAQEQQPAVAQ